MCRTIYVVGQAQQRWEIGPAVRQSCQVSGHPCKKSYYTMITSTASRSLMAYLRAGAGPGLAQSLRAVPDRQGQETSASPSDGLLVGGRQGISLGTHRLRFDSPVIELFSSDKYRLTPPSLA